LKGELFPRKGIPTQVHLKEDRQFDLQGSETSPKRPEKDAVEGSKERSRKKDGSLQRVRGDIHLSGGEGKLYYKNGQTAMKKQLLVG